MAPFAPSGPAVDDAVIAVARRDRMIVVILLAVAIVASWTYVLAGAGMDMPATPMASLPGTPDLPAVLLAPAMDGLAATVWSPAHAGGPEPRRIIVSARSGSSPRTQNQSSRLPFPPGVASRGGVIPEEPTVSCGGAGCNDRAAEDSRCTPLRVSRHTQDPGEFLTRDGSAQGLPEPTSCGAPAHDWASTIPYNADSTTICIHLAAVRLAGAQRRCIG